ncbi:13243_t:CDS:2, partial [Gigaspora margarita]
DDCWDSDNETVVEDYKKSVEVKNACNKIWKDRVAALVGKKKKKVFPSQEALDEACEAWLEKVSSFKQGIKSFSQQNQENSKDSSSQLAVSILKEVNFKFWRNFKFSIPNSPAYVAKLDDPYLHQWKT